MPSLGPQQGEELGGGGGGPPAWPSAVTPTLVECEEDEGRGEEKEAPSFSRRKGWRDGCEIMELFYFLSPLVIWQIFTSDMSVWQRWAVWTGAASESSQQWCLFRMVKIEVYLGSSNSLWSAGGCHWKEFTDCSHENWINKLIYWTEMFRNEMPTLSHCKKKHVFCFEQCRVY